MGQIALSAETSDLSCATEFSVIDPTNSVGGVPLPSQFTGGLEVFVPPFSVEDRYCRDCCKCRACKTLDVSAFCLA